MSIITCPSCGSTDCKSIEDDYWDYHCEACDSRFIPSEKNKQ